MALGEIPSRSDNFSDQTALYNKAAAFCETKPHKTDTFHEFKELVAHGWSYAWWCGIYECEQKVKEETNAPTHCITLEEPVGEGSCINFGKSAIGKVYFARGD